MFYLHPQAIWAKIVIQINKTISDVLELPHLPSGLHPWAACVGSEGSGRKEVIVVWWDASKVDPRELGTSVFSSLTLILKTNIICFDFSY